MGTKLSSLSFQDIVAVEKMLDIICKKYENAAQINMTTDVIEYQKAANSLTYFNNIRDETIKEMEKRVMEVLK